MERHKSSALLLAPYSTNVCNGPSCILIIFLSLFFCISLNLTWHRVHRTPHHHHNFFVRNRKKVIESLAVKEKNTSSIHYTLCILVIIIIIDCIFSAVLFCGDGGGMVCGKPSLFQSQVSLLYFIFFSAGG